MDVSYQQREKPLAIIGIDPGTTAAYVAIDLQGKLISHYSAKELVLSEIISRLVAVCHPVIVGTDKEKIPSFVEDFSRKTGCVLVFPQVDLAREEKRCLGKNYDLNNIHEQDALGAALFAYKQYSSKIEKISRFIQKHHLQYFQDSFYELALKEDLHFTLIKDLLTVKNLKKPEVEVMHKVVIEKKITKHDFVKLYGKLITIKEGKNHLERQLHHKESLIRTLRRHVNSLTKRSTSFNKKLDQLLHFKEKRLGIQQQEIKEQQERIAQLHLKIEELYSFIGKREKGSLVKCLPNFSKDAFLEKNLILQIKENDVLLIEDGTIYSEFVIRQLEGKGILILSCKPIPKILRHRLQVNLLSAKDVWEQNEYFALVNPQVIEKSLTLEFMENLVQDYQKGRLV